MAIKRSYGASGADLASKIGFKKAKSTVDGKQNSRLKKLERLIKGEEKRIEDASSTTADSSGFVTSLSDCAQGLTDLTRVGNDIQPQRIRMRYQVKHVAGVLAYKSVRVCLVRDKQTIAGGSPPAADDILEDVTLSNGSALNMVTFHEQEDRFEFLYDRVHDMAGDDDAVQTAVFTRSLKSKGKTGYSGAGATTVNKNAYYWLVISDTAAASSPPLIYWNSEMIFTDL